MPEWFVRTVPKAGMSDEESDDRAACRRDGRSIVAAVADGATEAAFAGRWAQDLTDAWMRASGAARAPQRVLTSARDSFSVVQHAREGLPWYGQRKLDEGSSAAVAWLRLVRTAVGYLWVCYVAGDCELVVISDRMSRVTTLFPYTNTEEFGYAPELLNSRPSTPAPLRWRSGRVRSGTELWLMTDALAQVCVSGVQQGQGFWRHWANASTSDEQFASSVAAARAAGQLRNDDVALVRIRV